MPDLEQTIIAHFSDWIILDKFWIFFISKESIMYILVGFINEAIFAKLIDPPKPIKTNFSNWLSSS